MKLVSLEQKYSEIGKESPTENDSYFPSLYLEKKQLESMSVGAVTVGTEMKMVATVRVSGVNEYKDRDRSVSFEIVEAAIAPKEKEPDAASVLFPNG